MKKQWIDWMWDVWCIVSGIGIWPRFIEPRLLQVTRLKLCLSNLPPQLEGLRVLQFSDLHWNEQFSLYLQKKMIRKVNALKPDIILFTGDFICRSKLEDREGLKQTLNALRARIGCFAVLGNHDYAQFVTVNEQGDYDVESPSFESIIVKGFKRLFHPIKLTKQITQEARDVDQHGELVALLKETSFHLLNNTTEKISCNGSWINITGLEEYSLGKFDSDIAFQNYDPRYPGLVLSHNPDTLNLLGKYPGNVIFCGHTHGGQVNLPGFWPRFTRIENLQFKRGLKKLGNKWAYINRGISAIMKFRWFALPELTLLTLQRGRG
ncbi:MAG: UDP-2,3-diacylglucosamine diphosphatase LpxG [Parachlamydiaceae bacterium]